MNIISMCMNLGTFLAAAATLPQIVAVWKDRSILRGYSWWGCAALCVAMILFATAFALMRFWPSVLCEVPVAIFWGLASFFSFKLRGTRNGKSEISE